MGMESDQLSLPIKFSIKRVDDSQITTANEKNKTDLSSVNALQIEAAS